MTPFRFNGMGAPLFVPTPKVKILIPKSAALAAALDASSEWSSPSDIKNITRLV